MARPLSIDLRERAVAAVLKGGQSRHRAAAQFGVAPSTVMQRGAGPDGRAQAKGHCGEHQAFLVQRIRDREFTLRGLVAELAGRGLKVDIDRCGTSFTPRSSASKKTVIASERDRPDIARRRARWAKRQKQIEPERLVFNTTKRRTHSLFRQGCVLYKLIPTMPEVRLLPLIERFTTMLANSLSLPTLSGPSENDGSREGPGSFASANLRCYRPIDTFFSWINRRNNNPQLSWTARWLSDQAYENPPGYVKGNTSLPLLGDKYPMEVVSNRIKAAANSTSTR